MCPVPWARIVGSTARASRDGAEEIDLHHRAQLRLRHVLEGAESMDSRVVDQHVDPSGIGDDRAHCLLDRGAARDVELELMSRTARAKRFAAGSERTAA